MRKNTILCLAFAVIFAFSTVGTSLAAWKVSDTSDHVINTASVTGKIIEQYETATGIYPGATVDKVVNVKNTGTADSVVRVKIEKAWGASRDSEGNLIVDSTKSTDNIVIDYNKEYWLYDENDGYYYYKGVLAPDETTAQPLFKEFTISKETGNEYSGYEADILVKMECVQAAFHGISIWDKTFSELGIVYNETEKPQKVTIATFKNPTDGFVFDPTDSKTYVVSVQDLFSNFKDLLPGETLSQTIKVNNSYSKATEIFLRADDITQSLSPDKVELVNRLLREYATIVVTDSSGKTIYNGPIWGNLSSSGTNPDTMVNNISLGSFAAGETKYLNVQLQIDPNMDNEYQELWGLIRWVWSASGDEKPTTPGDNGGHNPETPVSPNTDESYSVYIYGALTVLSGAALVITFVIGRRKRDDKVSE